MKGDFLRWLDPFAIMHFFNLAPKSAATDLRKLCTNALVALEVPMITLLACGNFCGYQISGLRFAAYDKPNIS